MKKNLILFVGVALATVLTACNGNVTVNDQDAADSQAVADEAATEEAAADEVVQPADTRPEDTLSEAVEESADESPNDDKPYNDPKSLPLYEYRGDEEYLGVISDYMIRRDMETNGENAADVYIPFSIIGQTDDKNPDDILVYGSFNICGYDLRNSTLVAVSGACDAGIFHLKKVGDGEYEVTSADLPLAEQESVKLFAPIPGLYDKIMAAYDEEGKGLQKEAIADYINANGLYISQWQDFGRAPEPVLNALPTPDEENYYTHTSRFGYSVTYDLREFSYTDTGDEEIYGKIEADDVWTGTMMSCKGVDTDDAKTAIADALSDTGAEAFDITDSVIGNNISCKRAAYDEKLSDGRIFRYICYAVPADGKTVTVVIHTTVEEGASGLSAEELENTFGETLKTFTVL